MFDVTDVRPIVQQLIQDNPNNRNPRDEDGSCLYRDGHGNMCLIGAMLNELELPIPDKVAPIFDVVLGDPELYPFTDKAIRYMSRIQGAADDDGRAAKWGSVVEAKIYRETFQ